MCVPKMCPIKYKVSHFIIKFNYIYIYFFSRKNYVLLFIVSTVRHECSIQCLLFTVKRNSNVRVTSQYNNSSSNDVTLIII